MAPRSSRGDKMASFLRKSHQVPASYEHDIQFENRNSEDVHRAALAASLAEHQRIQDGARRAVQLEELRTQQLRLQQLNIQEEERVQIEEARVKEEIRLRELENRKRQIPKVPAKVPTPPPQVSPPGEQPNPSAATSNRTQSIPQQQVQQPQVQQPQIQQTQNPQAPPTQSSLALSNPLQTAPPLLQQLPATTLQPTPQQQQPQLTGGQVKATYAQAPRHIVAGVHRYSEIHLALKNLRKYVSDGANSDKMFKKKAGEMRRSIRTSLGQLSKDKSANRLQVNSIVKVLDDARKEFPHPGVDPSLFMLSKPEPSDEAVNNGAQLGALFIYLLNYFGKYVIDQFINEAGVSPDFADPIGVVAVQIFSRPEFLWRGETLIDIMIAKFRVACPVLFGIRGSEQTEEGRARLGWKKAGGEWIPEQVHNMRMTGLGAGWAALSLRDFSKARFINPFPPTHYWQTLASIVSTPSDLRSSTQYIVLRSMIDGYEVSFFKFYGNAALAALRIALVVFPDQALEASTAASSLSVVADKLRKEYGLQM